MNEENKSGSSSGENVPPSSNWQMPNGSVLQKNRNGPKPNGSLPNRQLQSSPSRSEPTRSLKPRRFPMGGFPVNGKNTQIMTPTAGNHARIPINPSLDNPFPREQTVNQNLTLRILEIRLPLQLNYPNKLTGNLPRKTPDSQKTLPAPMLNGQPQSSPNRSKLSPSPLSQNQ